MQEFSKVGIDSKRTTAASVAIVALVVYLALIHLQSILMPLAIAILLYFMIKPPEQLIYQKVNNRFVSYGTVILTFIITIYFISIFLYDNLSHSLTKYLRLPQRLKRSEPSMQMQICTDLRSSFRMPT